MTWSPSLRVIGCALAALAAGACGPHGGGSTGADRKGGGGSGLRPIVAEWLADDVPAEDPLATTAVGIKDEVVSIKLGKHAVLPKATKATGAKGDPVVDVRNLTRTALTVWFSGECARKITVPPDSRTRAVLCPGDYVTAARIENPDILPFIGDQHLEHGAIYTLTFFIAKEPTVGKKKVVK